MCSLIAVQARMACSRRLLALAALGCLISPTVFADQQACEAGRDGINAEACTTAERPEAKPRLQKDHVFFQLEHAAAMGAAKRRNVAAAPQPEALSIHEDEALDPAADANEPAPLEDNGAFQPEAFSIYEDETLDSGAEGNNSAPLEDDGPGQVAAHDVTSATAGCNQWRVQRRRRHWQMCSCRRRNPTDYPWDLPAGMVCDRARNRIVPTPVRPAPPQPSQPRGSWAPTGHFKGWGWCRVELPPQNWNLKSCPVSGNTPVKVLTYNLYWWNLFGKRGGNDQSAGKLIARNQLTEKFDLMAFQECDDMHRILGDARSRGLTGAYELMNGGNALAIAFRSESFTRISSGKADVGEDHRDQYYGKRSVQWVRLRHRNRKTVLFVNHHGPLPVSRSGGCTGSSTSWNILRAISLAAQPGDLIILTGDFNAQDWSSRIKALSSRIRRVFSGTCMEGVDHFFSNCQATNKANLGNGGSDHDALTATFMI